VRILRRFYRVANLNELSQLGMAIILFLQLKARIGDRPEAYRKPHRKRAAAEDPSIFLLRCDGDNRHRRSRIAYS
jgi:hypothetical protein